MSDQHDGDLILGGTRRSTVIEDASVQAAMQPWLELECYRLGRGELIGRMDTLDLGSRQLVRESQEVAVQKLGITPPNVCTISCCSPDPSSRFSEYRPGEVDLIFFMPAGTEFDIYVPAGARTSYVSLDQEAFLRSARVLAPREWEHPPQGLTLFPAPRQAALKQAVDAWLESPGTLAGPNAALAPGAANDILLQGLLQLVTATRPDELRPSSTERSRAFQICRQARAFVEDSLSSDVLPSIVDVCAWVGVSERTLQYAFRAYVDMSPLAYLRLSRLNRVHAVLRASDPQTTTVTAVATRFGFLHIGRFSVDYRQVFGESPSAPLAS